VAGFDHIYAYGGSKYTFLAGLTRLPYQKLEDVNSPPPAQIFQSRPLVKFALSQVSQIGLRNLNRAFSLRLVDVLSVELSFVQCPPDTTLHTADFLPLYKLAVHVAHPRHSDPCCDGD